MTAHINISLPDSLAAGYSYRTSSQQHVTGGDMCTFLIMTLKEGRSHALPLTDFLLWLQCQQGKDG